MPSNYATKRAKLEFKKLESKLFQEVCVTSGLDDLLLSHSSNTHATLDDRISTVPCTNRPDLNSEINGRMPLLGSIQSSTDSSDFSDCDRLRNDQAQGEIGIGVFLREWALKFNIPHSALNDLLGYFKSHKCFTALPRDSRSLLRTPPQTQIRSVSPGHYTHIGLETNLIQTIVKYDLKFPSVNILYNIDGLPVFKSTTSQFWPILGYIENSNVPPFVIGVYYGNSKPENVEEFLSEFIEEVKQIEPIGINVEGRNISVQSIGFVCDAPAKSYVLCVKGHSGYFGCVKCKVKGTYLENRVCFPNIDAQLRQYNLKSITNGSEECESNIIKVSPVTELTVNFDSDFPLDYMHLICLGVTKKLILTWLRGNIKVFRLHSGAVESINQKLLSCRKFISKEFCRKPRSLREVDRRKATEFRQFLLYTGAVVLRNILPDEHYNLFLVRFVATRILACESTHKAYNNYAEKLMRYFVQEYGRLYGPSNVSYNVHNLIHISADCLKYGPLDKFSGFRFENELGQLKRLLRSPNQPLQQLHRRILERCNSSDCRNLSEFVLGPEHSDGPAISTNPAMKQYKSVRHKGVEYNISTPNNICLLSSGIPFLIENIICFSDETQLLGRRFLEVSTFFENPCSSSLLQVSLINESKKEERQTHPISNCAQKRMFHVVEFCESLEISVIPGQWLQSEDHCYWPPYKTDEKIRRAATKSEEPAKSWEIHRIRKLGRPYDTYIKAAQKAKIALHSSDLSSGTDKPRKRKPNQKYQDESSSEEEIKAKKIKQSSTIVPQPVLPSPPEHFLINNDEVVEVHTQEQLRAAILECNIVVSQNSNIENEERTYDDAVQIGSNTEQHKKSGATTNYARFLPAYTPRNLSEEFDESAISAPGANPIVSENCTASSSHSMISQCETRNEHSWAGTDSSTITTPNSSKSKSRANAFPADLLLEKAEISEIEFKRMVLLSLAMLNRKLDNLTFLQSKNSLTALDCEPMVIDGIPSLPIQTLEALDALETVLCQSDHKTRFGQLLAICGGATLSLAMKNVGAKLISEDLAVKFNYTGMKGKLSFERYKNICGCVAGALRYNFSTETITEAKFKCLIAHWFTNVADRLKKRQKRID